MNHKKQKDVLSIFTFKGERHVITVKSNSFKADLTQVSG